MKQQLYFFLKKPSLVASGTGGNSGHEYFSHVFQSFVFKLQKLINHTAIQTPIAFSVNIVGPAWPGRTCAKAVPVWPAGLVGNYRLCGAHPDEVICL